MLPSAGEMQAGILEFKQVKAGLPGITQILKFNV